MKAIVSGASGLLGRAVLSQFQAKDAQVIGLAFSRASKNLRKIDLTDTAALDALLTEVNPEVFIHCAAERRPDVVEKDAAASKHLNVQVPAELARLCHQHNALLIYISTDYVFDGNAPEAGYDVDAKTNPLNAYGVTKRDGEDAVLEYASSGSVAVLRVPVLYGEAESNSESAVNILANGARDTSKSTKMDDYATRYPTNVVDVARVLYDLAQKYQTTREIPSLLHFSSQTQFTKYVIACHLAKLFGLRDTNHLVSNKDPPGPNETPRPRDCHLSNRALQEYGINTSTVDFDDWWKAYIATGKANA